MSEADTGAPSPAERRPLEELLVAVARGDQQAFDLAYAQLSAPVFGLARRIVRDRAQAEEVAQEVLVEVWRTASRYRPDRGGAMAWVMTMTHRRAVDRVRSAQAASDREARVGAARGEGVAYDEVAETVEGRLERERVRRCLESLTALQNQSVRLAYYGGYTYAEVAQLLRVPLGTVKTRLRDGLIRMRDCLGVE